MGSPGLIPVDRAAALSRVKAPALALIVAAALGMALHLVAIAFHLLGTGINFAEMAGRRAGGGEADRIAALLGGGIGLTLSVLGLVLGALVIFGALRMQRLQGYGLALTATIVSMVPCLAPCSCSCIPLSLPLGIWALVVLMDQNVKAAFV